MLVCVNKFVKRQTSDSRFSHYEGTWEELQDLVVQNWEASSPGYREGVLLIRVPPDRFYSSVVMLNEGDKLVGGFEPRRKGEQPRKFVTTSSRRKTPAQAVDIVLYASELLGGEAELPPLTSHWEIISINASPTLGDTPINPTVLMHNHFGSSGGTATFLSDSDFIDTLRESFEYWRDKSGCG
ncbi:hypothetical protein CMI47_14410 [Candidatus Pacearchaeota archaeon]|nr:hypothetical protein [Candidatus Pacearchaeota archaeon]|tara:strand:- start:594 stop:1142 length:549 start_codon:yes stop_codon:yes gene_type:complete